MVCNPTYGWTGPTYPTYNCGFGSLTIWGEPPSIDCHFVVFFFCSHYLWIHKPSKNAFEFWKLVGLFLNENLTIIFHICQPSKRLRFDPRIRVGWWWTRRSCSLLWPYHDSWAGDTSWGAFVGFFGTCFQKKGSSIASQSSSSHHLPKDVPILVGSAAPVAS